MKNNCRLACFYRDLSMCQRSLDCRDEPPPPRESPRSLLPYFGSEIALPFNLGGELRLSRPRSRPVLISE